MIHGTACSRGLNLESHEGLRVGRRPIVHGPDDITCYRLHPRALRSVQRTVLLGRRSEHLALELVCKNPLELVARAAAKRFRSGGGR